MTSCNCTSPPTTSNSNRCCAPICSQQSQNKIPVLLTKGGNCRPLSFFCKQEATATACGHAISLRQLLLRLHELHRVLRFRRNRNLREPARTPATSRW